MSASENLTVLIVGPGGDRAKGGIGRMIVNLDEHWSTTNGPRLIVLDARGIGSLLWSPFLLLRTLAQIFYWRFIGGATLIHINMADRGSIVRKYVIVRTAKLVGLPVLLHLHTGNFIEHVEELPSWATRRIAWMFRSADRIVVLADVFRRFISARFEVPHELISVVYNGSPDILVPESAGSPSKTTKLAFFGRIEDAKGMPELFDALSTPSLRALDWSFTFAGLGDIDTYKDFAAEHGFSDRVSFPGWLDQNAAMRLLSDSDVMVLPSRYEGFPMIVLEALSVGTAVVVTKVGAIPEVLTDQENALLSDVKDANALAKNLESIISNGDLRDRLIKNGKALFDEMFSIAKQAETIEAIYRSIGADSERNLPRQQTAEVKPR